MQPNRTPMEEIKSYGEALFVRKKINDAKAALITLDENKSTMDVEIYNLSKADLNAMISEAEYMLSVFAEITGIKM